MSSNMMDDSENGATSTQMAPTDSPRHAEGRWLSARFAAHRAERDATGPALSLRMKARQLRAQADALEAAAKHASAPSGLASLFGTSARARSETETRATPGMAASIELALSQLPALAHAEVGGEHFDLEDLIHHACHVTLPAARAKGIELLVDYAPSLPNAFYGAAQPLQAWIEGALREAVAAGKDGYILVRLSGHMISPQSCRIVLSLEDDGRGLTPTDLMGLFAPHQPAPAAATGTPNRLILEQDGLMIWCESSPRKGTIFGVRLDLSSLDSGRRLPRGNLGRQGTQTALVVAPRFQSRAILERELITAGLGVALSRNLVEALSLVRDDSSPDVIFLDDSFAAEDACARLRRAGFQKAIVWLSALTPSSARPEGVDALLPKPLRRRDLYACLDQLAKAPILHKTATFEALPPAPSSHSDPEACAQPPQTYSTARAQAQDKSPRNMRVLMIEPHETNQMMVRKMLSGLPVDLRLLRDERGVLREVETKSPDLILLDVSLRRCEQIIAHIRASEIRLRRAHTPLIALSGTPPDQPLTPVETPSAPQFVTPRYCSTSLEKPLRKSALIKAIDDHRPAHCHRVLPEADGAAH